MQSESYLTFAQVTSNGSKRMSFLEPVGGEVETVPLGVACERRVQTSRGGFSPFLLDVRGPFDRVRTMTELLCFANITGPKIEAARIKCSED